MGDQFFEVFKPKAVRQPAAQDSPGRAEPERPAEASQQAARGAQFGYAHDYEQSAGVSRPARPGDERSITFRFEEVVVVLIGAMMLMVISFLLGWYGHAKSSEGALVGAGTVRSDETPAPPEDLGEIEAYDPKALEVNVRTKAPTVEKPAPKPRPGRLYSLQVIRFAAGDKSSADATKKKLEARGYAPVFIQTQGREVGVYVGKFASRDDPRIKKYQREIRAMSRHYRWCDLKPVH